MANGTEQQTHSKPPHLISSLYVAILQDGREIRVFKRTDNSFGVKRAFTRCNLSHQAKTVLNGFAFAQRACELAGWQAGS